MALPAPADRAPTDVVIAVAAAQLNWVDLIMLSGQYQHVPKPPYTPGLEYAGDDRVGAARRSSTCAVGDRVLIDGFTTGPRSLGAYQALGRLRDLGGGAGRRGDPDPGRADLRSGVRACSATTRPRTTA
jgi:NADPH:quinone reductase-like Zn-dependent oxidoreductase